MLIGECLRYKPNTNKPANTNVPDYSGHRYLLVFKLDE
ncbi:hypothetical protein Lp90_2720 [Lactiplantibacillus plantarum]|nr:hypothetical protein Lp90_2720 [Lactiplantibacillus plantarum]KZU74499.1 hypothetical protein Nizo2889_1722 [Lactiplantibacillus plantarum]